MGPAMLVLVVRRQAGGTPFGRAGSACLVGPPGPSACEFRDRVVVHSPHDATVSRVVQEEVSRQRRPPKEVSRQRRPSPMAIGKTEGDGCPSASPGGLRPPEKRRTGRLFGFHRRDGPFRGSPGSGGPVGFAASAAKPLSGWPALAPNHLRSPGNTVKHCWTTSFHRGAMLPDSGATRSGFWRFSPRRGYPEGGGGVTPPRQHLRRGTARPLRHRRRRR